MGNTIPLPDTLKSLEGTWEGDEDGTHYFYAFWLKGKFQYLSQSKFNKNQVQLSIGMWDTASIPKRFRAMLTFVLTMEPVLQGDQWVCKIDGHSLVKTSSTPKIRRPRMHM